MRYRFLRSRSSRLVAPVLVMTGLLCAGRLCHADDGEDGEKALPTLLSVQGGAPPAPAPQEPVESPWRTFELAGGATYSTLSTTLLMTHKEFGAGLAFDAEEALGLRREHLSPDAWTSFRFADRHRLKLQYEDISRTASRTLEQSVTVNGTVFTAGIPVHSGLGVQQIDLSYIWSFLKDDRMEIGLSIHADLARLQAAINSPGIGSKVDERFQLPVPLLGLDADFILVKDLWLRQTLRATYIPLTNFTGISLDGSTGLEFSFLKNLSVGIGVHYWILNLQKSTEDGVLGNFDGKLRFTSGGALVYLDFHL